MKRYVRAAGIDDAPFKFIQPISEIFFAVVRAPNYIEGLLRATVRVDGLDATETVIKRLNGSKFIEQLDVIFVDGCTVAGFNVVDIGEIYRATGVPVISVTRKRPDLEEIGATLRKKFDDWEQRMAIISKTELHPVAAARNPIYVGIAGTDLATAKLFLKRFTVQGSIPEPLRIAHMVASLYVLGETRGRS
ncbi:MAG: DUF99 family protein [Thermoplasmata archaeon]|nr:DUF99 family protein [Thermoplasmata archaeon]